LKTQALLRMAYQVALRSPDTSTQNGAILVDGGSVLLGECNRFPTGTKPVLERPAKYGRINHAERGVIYLAAKRGVSTDKLTMVCPWAACSVCAQAIIDSGISKLVVHADAMARTPEHWKAEVKLAFEMFAEAKLHVESFAGPVSAIEPIRFNGQLWTP
jgi:deoxycytidylate deaminase